jgi:hypothetical protein
MATWGVKGVKEEAGASPAAAMDESARNNKRARAEGGGKAVPKGGAKQHPPQHNNPARYKDLVGQVIENTRSIAYLSAVVFATIILPKESAFVVESLATGKQYFEQTKGKANHQLLSPHLHIWKAWLQTAQAHTQIAETEKKIISDFITTGAGSTLEGTAEFVKLATCKKTFDPDYFRIQYNINSASEEVADIVTRLMVKDGGVVKHNAQPKGPRERRLEALLKKSTHNENEGG